MVKILKLKFRQDFDVYIWSRHWRCILVANLKLKLCRDFEAESRSRFKDGVLPLGPLYNCAFVYGFRKSRNILILFLFLAKSLLQNNRIFPLQVIEIWYRKNDFQILHGNELLQPQISNKPKDSHKDYNFEWSYCTVWLFYSTFLSYYAISQENPWWTHKKYLQ